jgi:hypothetical protein
VRKVPRYNAGDGLVTEVEDVQVHDKRRETGKSRERGGSPDETT